MIFFKRFFFGFFYLICAPSFAVKSVGVFCSADDKISEYYKNEAFVLGYELAKYDIQLITGGSKTGLMKSVIDGYVQYHNNDAVYGVMPKILKEFDVCHPLLKETHITWTDTISQRLDLFIERCDLVIILPGGWGTLHELINFLVHQQFGYCRKKIILLDSNQYWTYLIAQFNIMVTAGALSQKHLDQLIVVTSIEGVVENFSSSPADCNGLSDRFWEQVILKL